MSFQVSFTKVILAIKVAMTHSPRKLLVFRYVSEELPGANVCNTCWKDIRNFGSPWKMHRKKLSSIYAAHSNQSHSAQSLIQFLFRRLELSYSLR